MPKGKRARQGLYAKYLVSLADGTPRDPGAQYFVLRVDADPHARTALRAYAAAVREDNPLLWVDLLLWLDQLEEG